MLNPEYVVGMVDGEGSFTAYIQNPDMPSTKKRRVRVEPRFYIKLIEKDKDILYKLKEFFGCGSVYFQKDARPNHQNCFRFEVYNRKDLSEIIIPFFRKHKLKFNSKRSDFETFCLLMEMIQKDTHRTKPGLRQMFVLKQTMR